MSQDKVYNIKPIGIVFSSAKDTDTFKTLNGEEFKRTKELTFLAEVKPVEPLDLPKRVTKALFNRNYNLDLVQWEIIEKAKSKVKKKKVKKVAKKKGKEIT